MNTGDGHLEVIALAINTIGDHLYYSADPSFIHNYGGILLLDNIIKWNLKKHFVAWMKSIIYHSFLRHSFEGEPGAETNLWASTEVVNIKVGNEEWTVNNDHGHLHYPTFDQFIENLDLDTLDYLFVWPQRKWN
ncbi:hypothetical protein RHMOL_Rhmol01G0241700 [Rhododendron molle]|uniref:Uncharacterized protein n=1 Tax=Rhododendron molle TaxID=49168 RepID=A0ACC0Q680_RHOML|nr:hypothetical protein RHMOL_Rhmol01G0241700 [Rhododendron molle]